MLYDCCAVYRYKQLCFLPITLCCFTIAIDCYWLLFELLRRMSLESALNEKSYWKLR